MSKIHKYQEPVVRMETFEVSEAELNQERRFQEGKADRIAGRPCKSANGAYLNGWYSPEIAFFYISKYAAHLL